MNKPTRTTHPIIKMMNNSLVDLPAPMSMSMMWNFGSLLGNCLIIQVITGVFLEMHYTADIEMAIKGMIHICRDVNNGWLMRNIHMNGVSMFFICIYLHTGRGMYYGSYMMKEVWLVGVILMFLTMATAFIGYILPWGQNMSFWWATVITNLLSAIPYIGNEMVKGIWGGFAVDNATLFRFFTIHFILPLMILGVMMMHLIFLHQTASNNPLGINSNTEKIKFHPFFMFKDSITMIIMISVLSAISLKARYMLSDPDNFIPANPMVTPVHIQPEWYFLFAHEILRSNPNKLGGEIALLLSISILMILPFYNKTKFQGTQFYPMNQVMFWGMATTVGLLTWIGKRPVEEHYILTGKILPMIYFSYFITNPWISKMSDSTIKN